MHVSDRAISRPVPVVDLVRLDAGVRELYPRWLRREFPPKIKRWFEQHQFAVITSRYGQNTAIHGTKELASQAQDWARLHQWDELRYISFAIATDTELVLYLAPLMQS